MAARRHAAILLVLCAVFWSTGGLLIKSIAWPALAVADLRSALGEPIAHFAKHDPHQFLGLKAVMEGREAGQGSVWHRR